MSKFVQTRDTVFNWSDSVIHQGYCIVPVGKQYVVFSPAGDRFCDAYDSVELAMKKISMVKLELLLIEMLCDFQERGVISSEQYGQMYDHVKTEGSKAILAYVQELIS